MQITPVSIYSTWSLVREENTLNNERQRDLLISILSNDKVSAFLMWVKTRN